MTCPICISNYNKTTCVEVKCACDYSACKTCVRTYLIETTKESHCMNCRVKWSTEVTKNGIGATFYNKKYREHKTKQLLDQVIARREEYLTEAIIFRDDRDDNSMIAQLTKEMHSTPKMFDHRTVLYNAIEDIKNRIQIRHRREPRFRCPLRDFLFRRDRPKQKPIKPKRIMPCQINDCNGMLDENYCCPLCFKTTCSECHEIKCVEHKCNPDSVASTKALIKESKPCPKCACRISKIDGCDQMWCVLCQTAFSWNTGEIEQGKIHNPHYYQFLREKGQPIRTNDVREQALMWMQRNLVEPETNVLRESTVEPNAFPEAPIGYDIPFEPENPPENPPEPDHVSELNYITEFIRYVNFISFIVINRLTTKIRDINQNKTDNIYLYMLGEMSKTALGTKLYLIQHTLEKHNAFLDVYNAIIVITDDICNDIVRGQVDAQRIYHLFQKYVAYFNIELLKLVKYYETKHYVDIFEFPNRFFQKQYHSQLSIDNDLQKYNEIYNSYKHFSKH